MEDFSQVISLSDCLGLDDEICGITYTLGDDDEFIAVSSVDEISKQNDFLIAQLPDIANASEALKQYCPLMISEGQLEQARDRFFYHKEKNSCSSRAKNNNHYLDYDDCELDDDEILIVFTMG